MPLNRAVLDNILLECVKCGRCLSVCPTYKELNDEFYSSRGRIAICELFSDNKKNIEYLKDSSEKCLLCLKCRGICEKDVNYLKAVANIRESTISKSLVNIIISHSLQNLDKINRISRLLPKAVFKLFTGYFMDDSFFYLKLFKTPISRVIPNYYIKPAYLKNEIAHKKEEADILYFPGCGSNLLIPEIANDTIKLLRLLDIPFVIPEGLSCCGFPLYYNGITKKAEAIKAKNTSIFKGLPYKKILTTCPTCRTALIEWYKIDEDKVTDISKLLADKNIFKTLNHSQNNLIFYHKPCHFSGKHPVKDAEKLLSLNKCGISVSTDCCGGGGSFFVKNNALSLSILKKATDCIKQRSDIISSCPLCMFRLADGLYRGKKDVRLYHFSTYILSKLNGKRPCLKE